MSFIVAISNGNFYFLNETYPYLRTSLYEATSFETKEEAVKLRRRFPRGTRMVTRHHWCEMFANRCDMNHFVKLGINGVDF